jgi:hypothetical protein
LTRTSIREGPRLYSEDIHYHISGKTSPLCWQIVGTISSSSDNSTFATGEGNGIQEGDATRRRSQFSTRHTLASTLRRWWSWSRSWGRWRLPWYTSTSAHSLTTEKMATHQRTEGGITQRRNG